MMDTKGQKHLEEGLRGKGMAQQLGMLTALAEDGGLFPNTPSDSSQPPGAPVLRNLLTLQGEAGGPVVCCCCCCCFVFCFVWFGWLFKKTKGCLWPASLRKHHESLLNPVNPCCLVRFTPRLLEWMHTAPPHPLTAVCPQNPFLDVYASSVFHFT
jgi:hypothetical protein